jgi:hypothetical protein
MTKDEIKLARAYARMRIEWAKDDLARRVGTIAMQRAEIADATETLVEMSRRERELGWAADAVPTSST